MFLTKTIERNPALVECAFALHRRGDLLPDTYVIDADALRENALCIQQEARQHNVRLYFMLKQLGHNPAIAHMLMELGYDGTVAVDWREALTLARAGVKLGHVGHLVQTPLHALEEIMRSGVEIMTVYTPDKLRQVDETAAKLGICQPVMVRVTDGGDMIYPGQRGGVALETLPGFAKEARKLSHVRLEGVCSFPCLLYDEQHGDICATQNAHTVNKAAQLLTDMGFTIVQRNMPSAACAHSMALVAALGGTHSEPGHGLTGTTPYHATHDAQETPAMVYVSEISHSFEGRAQCYGGGYYRRGRLESALVGNDLAGARRMAVVPPDVDSIDYHFELDGPAPNASGVVMAFRTQIFVTRSLVAVLEGISRGEPRIAGIYDSLGSRMK